VVKKLIYIAVIITLVLQFIGCDGQQQVQPSGKKIKVGIIGPFTGNDKFKGKDGLKGIRVGLQMYPYLNNGDGIELVVEDDQNDPDLTVKALQKLTEDENVSAIIIMSTSASVLAVNSIADDYRTPVLVLIATHRDIAKNTSFVSQLCFDNIFQGMVAALYARDELLIDNVAVFKNPRSFHSTSLADEFIRKYESLGGRITDIVPVTPGAEITAQILDVIRENGAELLYLPIGVKKLIEILKTTREMGWDPIKMGSDGQLSTVVRQYEEDVGLLEGLLAIDLYTEDVPYTSFGKKATKAYRKIYKSRATTYVAAGVEGFAVLFQAMNRCSDPGDRECINSMIRDTSDFEGLAGKISIQPDGKAVRPLIVNTIRNGYMKFVVKVY
jgi:branched-chain amino acid transport system substrate-binding protein